VTPMQYPELAALVGETADNLPGVPGVGPGFAARWLNKYGSLKGILDNIDSLGVKREPHCVNTSTMSNETANSTPSLRICNCLLRLPTLLWPTRIETWWPNFSMHWNSTRFEIVSLAPLNSDLVAQKNKP